MYYIKNEFRSPYFNLALEEYLLRYSSDDIFMIWRDSPAIVCGRGQNIYEEADVCAASDEGVSICRRFSGGGTVYHDEGNINYTFILNYGGDLDYSSMLAPVVNALNSIGVPAEAAGCDITANGKKISGNAQARVGDRLLHHGTLLFDSNIDRLDRLTGERRAFCSAMDSRAVKSRVAAVANIKDFLPADLAFLKSEDFESQLRRLIFPEAEETRLDDVTILKAEALASEKYSSWEWIYGYSPRFHFRSDGVEYTAKRGIIESVSSGFTEDVRESLIGARLSLDSLVEAGIGHDAARLMLTGK